MSPVFLALAFDGGNLTVADCLNAPKPGHHQREYAMTTKLYLATAMCALLAACGEGSSAGGDTNNSTTAVQAAQPISLGQTGKADGLDLTVTAVATPSQVGPAEAGLKAEAGETFVVVSYTLKNTSDKPLPMMERPGLELVDGEGQTYAPDTIASPMAAILMDDPTGMAADLNPNISAKTKAAWKIDKVAFNKETWKLVLASDPQLTFALK